MGPNTNNRVCALYFHHKKTLSMATCGPSNPAQNIKNFALKDKSLQQEFINGSVASGQRGFKSIPTHGAQQQQNLQKFVNIQPDFQRDQTLFENGRNQTINQFYGNNNTSFPNNAGYLNPIQTHNHTQHKDWVGQFSQFSLNDNAPLTYNEQKFTQMPGMQPHMPMFMQLTPQYGIQPQSTRTSNDEAFNAAFAEAELSFKMMHETSTKAEKVMKQGEDASDAANRIIGTLHEKVSDQPELTEKLNKSKFMNLMTKLSTNEVMLGDKEFVDANNDKVDPFELQQDVELAQQYSGLNDWAPQRKSDPEEKTTQKNDENRLDDPETYLFKMKKNLDPRVFKRSQYTSPFQAGKEHALNTLKQSDWEENYKEW